MPLLKTGPSIGSFIHRYGVALFIFALSLFARLALAGVLGATVPFITFFPGVVISSWYGGLGPGLFTTALSTVVAVYLFFLSAAISTADVVGLILFVTIGAVISWVNHARLLSERRAYDQLLARQQSEEALRESEERYRVMTETAVDGIITIDQNSKILLANSGAERMFGYSGDELRGSALTMLIPQYARDVHKAALTTYIESGQKHIAWEGVYLVGVHQDGHEIPLEVSFGELRRGPDRLFTGVMRDITDRKRAEEMLRRNERRFRALIENSSDAIAIINEQGAVRYASVSTERVLGYTPEEFVHRNVLDLVHEEDRHRVQENLALLSQSDEAVTMEARCRHKDGSWRWIESTATNALQESDIEGIVVNYRDTSERRRLEEQFMRAQKMEAVGRLAGGVAHDFNNLLTVINGYSELALDMLGKDAPLYESIDEILKAGTRASSLTKQLLAFSRQQILAPKVLNLNSIVSDMERMLRRLIGEDIQLVTVLDPALEAVQADPGQIEQAIMNLAVNSRHAMPQGGQLTIETANVYLDDAYTRQHRAVAPGAYVMLAVSDTGVGMDENTQARIFEPFFTTKEKGAGTGLGLSMVYGFVRQSGGHIWVYSEPGKGTTFKVYLPSAQASAVKPASPPRRPERLARGSETVLVVEDEEAVRKLIRSVLQQAGYTVLEAQDGAKALRLCETYSKPIDLALSDVVLPHMSGRELANSFASLRPEMDVLFMSGYTDDAVVRHGILNLDVPFLQKPFTPAALAKKVREVLDATR